jgi:hypothetical protein
MDLLQETSDKIRLFNRIRGDLTHPKDTDGGVYRDLEKIDAVKTHIWCALISMLLLRYLQLRSRFGWSLFEPGRAAAHESIYASRSSGMARSAVCDPTRP